MTPLKLIFGSNYNSSSWNSPASQNAATPLLSDDTVREYLGGIYKRTGNDIHIFSGRKTDICRETFKPHVIKRTYTAMDFKYCDSDFTPPSRVNISVISEVDAKRYIDSKSGIASRILSYFSSNRP